MYLCDSCGADLVGKGIIRPHAEVVWPIERIRYVEATCSLCGERAECTWRTDIPGNVQPKGRLHD